jgi:hypothetical protein
VGKRFPAIQIIRAGTPLRAGEAHQTYSAFPQNYFSNEPPMSIVRENIVRENFTLKRSKFTNKYFTPRSYATAEAGALPSAK